MEPYTTYEEHHYFSIAMSDSVENGIDNEQALGFRYVLVYVESGSGIASVNERQIPFISPCVFCINEQEHFVIQEASDVLIRAIYFHPGILNCNLTFELVRNLPEDASVTLVQDCDLIKFFLKRDDHFVGKFNLGPGAARKVSAVMENIHIQLHDQSIKNWPCRNRSYVMQLLFLLDNLYTIGDCTDEEYLGPIEDEFYPILIYIYHNYEKKISVTELTEKFNLNRTTLSKMFQENLGENFVSYLNRIRVSIAATMLRDTLLPVYEIMERVGFNDNAHFLRTFKKITGISPSDYRKQYCWM